MVEASMGTMVLWAAAAQMPEMEGSPGQVPFGHADGHMMGWHWGWWLVWLIIAVVVIWALVRLTTARHGNPNDPASENPEAARRR